MGSYQDTKSHVAAGIPVKGYWNLFMGGKTLKYFYLPSEKGLL